MRPSGRESADEPALIERLRAGDEAAFAWLVDRYHGRLLRLAMTFVGERSAAEEVVQDAWLGVIQGLATFEGRSSLKTWIFRILANRAKTRRMRDARSAAISSATAPDHEDEPAVDPARFHPHGKWADPPRRLDEDSPERVLMRREVLHVLREAAERLPPNQRCVVILRDLEGLEAGEVCNILAISETNQRVLLHRGRSRLRRALEEYLGGA